MLSPSLSALQHEIWLDLPGSGPQVVDELGTFRTAAEARRVAALLGDWLHLGLFGAGLRAAVAAGAAGEKPKWRRRNLKALLWLPDALRARGYDPARVAVRVEEEGSPWSSRCPGDDDDDRGAADDDAPLTPPDRVPDLHEFFRSGG